MRRMTVDALLEIFREKQAKDSEPYWGCLTEPTRAEIAEAVRIGNLVPWEKDGDKSQYQGKREWQIGRIAWLVVNWTNDWPIKVNKARTNIDGGHRLYAARHLGIHELETVDL